MAIKFKNMKPGTKPTPKAKASKPATPDTKQIPLVTETPATAKPVTTMNFESGEEVNMAGLAFERYRDDLTKEAKKLTELGKSVESRSLMKDVKRLDEGFLPQVRPQTSLPFNSTESLSDMVSRVIGATVRAGVVRAMKNNVEVEDDETYDAVLAQRTEEITQFERVVGHIVEQTTAAVIPFIREITEQCYEGGVNARTLTPEAIARRAILAVAAEVTA